MLILSGIASWVGCSDPVEFEMMADPTVPQTPLFAVTGAVVEAGGVLSPWLLLFSSIEADLEFDLDQALSPGPGVFFAPGDGSVLWLQQDAPIVQRFQPTADGGFESYGQLSFGSFGITNASQHLIVSISPTKAYLIDRLRPQFIVWNPQTLEIEGRTMLMGLKRPDLVTNIEFVDLIDDRVVVVARYRRDFDDSWAPLTVAAFLDPVTNDVTYAEDERCGNVVSGVQASDGLVYVGSFMTSAAETFAGEGGSPAVMPCQVRLSASDQTFDDDYFVDLAAWTPSGLIGGPLAISGDALFYSVFDPASPLPPPGAPSTSLTRAPVWQLHTNTPDGGAETLTPIGGLPLSGTLFSLSTFDGIEGRQTTLGLFAPNFSESTVFDISEPEAPSELFSTPGPIGQIVRVR
ncbi:MAG: hypothetical protein AAGA48_09435 [Myxococcota bacterium]